MTIPLTRTFSSSFTQHWLDSWYTPKKLNLFHSSTTDRHSQNFEQPTSSELRSTPIVYNIIMAYINRNLHSMSKKWHGENLHPYIRKSTAQRTLDFRCRKLVSVYQHPYWKEAVICATVANRLSLEIAQWKHQNSRLHRTDDPESGTDDTDFETTTLNSHQQSLQYDTLQHAHVRVNARLSNYCRSLSDSPNDLKKKMLLLKHPGTAANADQMREELIKWKTQSELRLAKDRRQFELLKRKQFISAMQIKLSK